MQIIECENCHGYFELPEDSFERLNRKVAAELLGIGRTTLYSKLEEYGLKYKFRQS